MNRNSIKNMTTLTKNQLISVFNKLKKKYNLPDYEELDKMYSITQILMFYYNDPIENELIFAINKIMYEKLNYILNEYYNLMYNTEPSIVNQTMKKIMETKKEIILKEYLDVISIVREGFISNYSGNIDNASKSIIKINDYMKVKTKIFIDIYMECTKNIKEIDTKKIFGDQTEKTNYYG